MHDAPIVPASPGPRKRGFVSARAGEHKSSAIYRIVGKTVEIHGVLDGRRSLEDVLLERILHA